mgnify:FL=1
MPRKLKIDTSKIMIWQKFDSISGEFLIGIELPKSIEKDQRLLLAYNLGWALGGYSYKPMVRFTRIFKGDLVKKIKVHSEPLKTFNALFKCLTYLLKKY